LQSSRKPYFASRQYRQSAYQILAIHRNVFLARANTSLICLCSAGKGALSAPAFSEALRQQSAAEVFARIT